VSTAEFGHEKQTSLEFVAGGSIVEAVGGLAGVVLGILGLAGVDPALMASIAALAIGAALLSESGALAGRYSSLLADMPGAYASQELGTGMTAELIGGATGVALGILAILGVAPTVLLSVAALVFGASLLVGSAATARMNDLRFAAGEGLDERTRRIMHEAVSGATGAQVMVGLGGIALGILALVGLATLSLVLVAMLAVGVSILLTGSAVGARVMSVLKH
jgi:hypothetical protein